MSRDDEDTTPDEPAKPSPYRELVTNPAARTYLMLAGGGLLVAMLTMFLVGSPIAAALLLVVGLCGLVLRWTAMPVVFVLLVSWLSFAPLGLPFDAQWFSNIPGSHFRFLDFILVGASLVYLIGQYRLLSIVHIGMPFDAAKRFVKPGAKPTVRPAEPPGDRELWMLFARVGLAALAGQFLWFAITCFRVDFEAVPPLVYRLPNWGYRQDYDPLFIVDYLSRFLLALGFFLTVALAARFAFWYWGLLQLRRDQARLILVDTQWAEDRRELDRQEKWRGWQKSRLLGARRAKFGCGTVFLAVGLPAILLLLFFVVLCCSGGIR